VQKGQGAGGTGMMIAKTELFINDLDIHGRIMPEHLRQSHYVKKQKTLKVENKYRAGYTQNLILQALGSGERSIKDIANMTGKPEPTIRRNLSRLHELGAVSRHGDKDNRTYTRVPVYV